MPFNSVHFLLFFPIVCICYAFIAAKTKSNSPSLFFLLAASLYFYAYWKPAYLVLILASVIITWLSGLGMECFPARKKLVLITSLVLNLAILFFFKYYNWLAETVSFPLLNVVLPVGISFYTFQAVGYSLDVYWGNLKAERDFLNYALFVTFFPQLVAGPIERAENLLPQFKAKPSFDYGRITDGLKLMAWGLFLKIVIADRMAVYVNSVYRFIDDSYGTALLLATVCFAIQVYADFAGYSNIAIGVAQVLGFKLMKNFDHPYFSSSIPEFWRRWHISLGSWFRDYLYYPVGFASWNRKFCSLFCGKRRENLSKMMGMIAAVCVWLATGLWHGAAWHFVAWGALHGAYILISIITEKARGACRKKLGLEKDGLVIRPWHCVQVLMTFVMVNAGYVFFRASGIGNAFRIFKKFLAIPSELAMAEQALYTTSDTNTFLTILMMNRNVTGVGLDFMFVNLFLCLVLFISSLVTRHKDGREIVNGFPLVVRWTLYLSLLFGILIFRSLLETEFLYFQF
ncbi:MAG: MBOAT family protein [Treponema sp.]|nr:MBOAT family protein [Treponema sp.]